MQGVQVGREATLSVRPEKLQLVEQADGGVNCYEVIVRSIAYVGSDTRVVVMLGEHRIDVWEQNTVSTLDPNYFFKPGERAWLSFKPENALVLAE
jgi:ABC-type Fe3+/spermidine/putrescine transport system ATPase subunit